MTPSRNSDTVVLPSGLQLLSSCKSASAYTTLCLPTERIRRCERRAVYAVAAAATSATYHTRTPDLGLVFPPFDAVVDKARHVRNLLDGVLQQGAVRVVRLGVLQHTLQKQFVPACVTHAYIGWEKKKNVLQFLGQ